ncbi:MAG: energy transducer TonB [Saprospiraceae bacterium]|nr:energy transducer TonB [Saprospiraceae bacterium]
MKFPKQILFAIPIFGMITFSACSDQKSNDDNATVEVDDYTPAIEKVRAGTYPFELTLDPEFSPEMGNFTYRLPEPVVTPETDQGKNPQARMVKNMPDAYNTTEVDKAPVFGKDCNTAEDPQKCTNEAIQSYFFDVISYPEEAKENHQEGYYNVTFTLDENGKVGEDFRVVTKDAPCDGCAEAAVTAIAEMPAWQPAIKDGKPVTVELTIPVRFHYRMK